MNGNPWEQDDGLDGDDFVEGIDDEDEELGVDYHSAELIEGDDEPAEPLGRPNGNSRPNLPAKRVLRQLQPGKGGAGKKKFRIRRMSDRMAARSPNVSSILITRVDGSQVLLVKGGR